MKRSERKKMKTDANQGHANPHPDGRDKYERHVDGSIHVRGEIETKRPPDLAKEHATERKEDTTQERKKYVVEAVTLIFVIIVAGLTGYQACLSREQIQISERGSRPFIGPLTFTMAHEWLDETGKWQVANTKTPPATRAEFQSVIKNFGPVAGENYRGWLDAYVGDKLLKGMNREQAPFPFFPSQTQEHVGGIEGEDYRRVMAGEEPLRLEITISYDYAEGHSYDCREYRYVVGANQFTSFAPCKK
jgi:hypothetical protein